MSDHFSPDDRVKGRTPVHDPEPAYQLQRVERRGYPVVRYAYESQLVLVQPADAR